MKEQIEKLQMVKNTLGVMEIPPRQQNAIMLAGIYQYIDDVMKALENTETVDMTPALKEEDV